MTFALRPLLVLLAVALPAAAEETAAPDAAEEGQAAEDTGVLEVLLNVAGLDYRCEVAAAEGAPADVRLSRADGTTMADQGYLVPELGHQACKETGFRFDESRPAVLEADGSWMVEGGCQ